ncbi:MAG: hypothetical protein V3W41_15710 [Planctomycetota bacterium]
MKSLGFLLLGPILGLSALSIAGQSVIISPDALALPSLCHYDLTFQPPADKRLVVSYEATESWNYVEKDGRSGMSGKSTKTATLHWTFKKQGRQSPYLTSGRFMAASYLGSSTKAGKKSASDIVWTRGGGYEKGQGCHTDKTWFAGEMKETLAFPIDRRGEARPGEC